MSIRQASLTPLDPNARTVQNQNVRAPRTKSKRDQQSTYTPDRTWISRGMGTAGEFKLPCEDVYGGSGSKLRGRIPGSFVAYECTLLEGCQSSRVICSRRYQQGGN